MAKIKTLGFALPTVLIASMVMLAVLFVSISSTAATRSSLSSQYYSQIAKSASDAGAAYAKSCLNANNGTPLWNSSRPLRPGTDCAGNQIGGFTCPDGATDSRCYVMVDANNNINSTFSVAGVSTDSNGNLTDAVSSGTVNLLRESMATPTPWRQYNQSSRLVVVVPMAQILAVGGGGGATQGGGGGGGLVSTNQKLSPGTYTVAVGAGGIGQTASGSYLKGTNGGNSVFGTITAYGGGGGGGGGGSGTGPGANGASGGGGAATMSGTMAGGTATPAGQGYNGGSTGGITANPYPSGGGGGAGAVGSNATTARSGNGGAGLSSSLRSGTSVCYAGGGAGGMNVAGGTIGTATCGGGNGTNNGSNAPSGTPNTGGGGGGAGSGRTGGNGGSGIIVVSFPVGSVTVGTVTGSPQITTPGGTRTVYTFLTVGSWSFQVTSLNISYTVI